MTDKNTEIMRDVFRLLSEFEMVPDEENPAYWTSLTRKANEMVCRWELDSLAFHLVNGLIDGLSAKYQAKTKQQQLSMEAIYCESGAEPLRADLYRKPRGEQALHAAQGTGMRAGDEGRREG